MNTEMAKLVVDRLDEVADHLASQCGSENGLAVMRIRAAADEVRAEFLNVRPQAIAAVAVSLARRSAELMCSVTRRLELAGNQPARREP